MNVIYNIVNQADRVYDVLNSTLSQTCRKQVEVSLS